MTEEPASRPIQGSDMVVPVRRLPREQREALAEVIAAGGTIERWSLRRQQLAGLLHAGYLAPRGSRQVGLTPSALRALYAFGRQVDPPPRR